MERTGTLMLGLEVGVSHAFAEDRSSITATAKPGGSLDVSLLWRSVPWVAMGLQLGFAGLPVRVSNVSTVWATSALAQARFLLPIRRVDLWADLGVGFGALTQTVDFTNASRVTMLGPSLAVGLGVEVFVHRRVSVGTAFRIVRIFTGQYCLDDTCAPPGTGLDHGILWRAVLSLTYHVPVAPPKR
jgi:hypothetical protein